MKIPAALLALALVASLPLPAAGASFGRVDGNADGMITPEEASRGLKGLTRVHFNKCDSNRDGLLDKSEFGCVSLIYDRIYRNG